MHSFLSALMALLHLIAALAFATTGDTIGAASQGFGAVVWLAVSAFRFN